MPVGVRQGKCTGAGCHGQRAGSPAVQGTLRLAQAGILLVPVQEGAPPLLLCLQRGLWLCGPIAHQSCSWVPSAAHQQTSRNPLVFSSGFQGLGIGSPGETGLPCRQSSCPMGQREALTSRSKVTEALWKN